MDRERPPALGAFLAELGRRLDDLGPDGIRSAIVRRATSLRPSERRGFLALFDPVEDVAPAAALDADIAAFEDDVAALPPQHRWGGRGRWDDDDDDPRLGEGLMAEDLLVAVGERFLEGEVAWAADAYQRLFGVLRSTVDDDRNLDLDVDRALATEARNRLLWALARTVEDPADAAEQMVAAVDLGEFCADDPRFDDFRGARPGADSIPDEVLRAFADELSEEVRSRPGWQLRGRLGLALEIRVHLDGIDAVIDSAREDLTPRLDTYCWLVDHLVAVGEVERAAELGEEVLARGSNSYDLASLADDVAALWRGLGQPARALSAQCRSWESRPTAMCLERALDAAAAAGDHEVPAAVIEHPSGSRFLQVAVSLFGGDIGAAVAIPTGTDPNPSHDRYAADRVAIVAACHGAVGGDVGLRTYAELTSACNRAEVAGWIELRDRPDDPPATPLAERLAAALAATEADPSRIDAARALVDRLAERILGAKDRPAYAVAASMAVLLAITAEQIDETTPAAAVIDVYDDRYRRFAAFRSELREARAVAGM